MIDLERPAADAPQEPVAGGDPQQQQPQPVVGGGAGEVRRLNLLMVGAAAALSASGAGWMVGGMFRGALPRAICLLGALLGSGLATLALRTRRPAPLLYLVVPVSALAGGVLIAPEATGGSANLFGLIGEALHSGGLLQPPVPFDPGWRFLLVVFLALVGAAAVAVAAGFGRARLAAVTPIPVTFAATLFQPKGTELVSTSVALFLVIASLAVSYGAELAATARMTGSFETRRLGRAAALLAALMVGVVLLSQTSFLFPPSKSDNVIPPRRPTSSAPEPDRQLFTVRGDKGSKGPWRVGVEDVYDGSAWLLPAVDPARLRALPGGSTGEAGTGPTEKVSFTVSDLSGRWLPMPAEAGRIAGAPDTARWDPETGVAQLDERVPQGLHYTVEHRVSPGAAELNRAPAPPPDIVRAYGAAPPAPDTVRELISKAPAGAFDRLQFVRDALYHSVVAAGSGNPVDVPPARVVAMLHDGNHATPFEITAAEALLARWAGLPSRIAFGYYGGASENGVFSVHPRDGAAWLEVYFQGYGWVPLIGTPPRAAASLDNNTKKDNPAVTPSEDLALTVLVPTRVHTFLQIFEIVRYWVMVALPFVAGGVLLLVGYPVILKAVRRRRRARWSRAGGPIARVLVAYAEMRDACHDLNLGDVRDSPLEFTARFVPDEEHEELAWLVTRVVWGDLRRDARREDAEIAEQLSHSVRRRVGAEQPALNRLLGAIARASLRDPWTDDVPNVWMRRPALRRPRLRSLLRLPRWRRRAVAAATAAVALLGLAGCGVTQAGFTGAVVPVRYPDNLVPAPDQTILGLHFVREPTAEAKYTAVAPDDRLVSQGRVYAMEHAGIIEGSLQVAVFRPEVDATDATVRGTVESAFHTTLLPLRVGTEQLLMVERPEQWVFLWFPPDRNAMVVVVLRKKYASPLALVRDLVLHQRGIEVSADPLPTPAPTAAPTGTPAPSPTPTSSGG
jgi:hypothetical protein